MEKDKQITVISSLPPIKGISMYTVGLAEALAKKMRVTVLGFNHIYPEFIYPGSTKDPAKKAPVIKNLENRSVLNWYNPLGWVAEGFKIKSKVVHVQWWSYILAPVYLTILSIAKLRRKKIIITVHNVEPHEKSRLARLANRSVLRLGDWFIVHTEQAKGGFMKNYPKYKNKVSVIAHGVSAPAASYSKKEARKALGLAESDKAILFFGNIRPYKGLDDLIEAFSLARKDIAGLKLIIAGQPWAAEAGKYQKIIEQKGIKGDVLLNMNFIPEPDVPEYFAAADLAVLPYKFFDAQSGVATVSVQYGLPLLVTGAGGLPELTDKSAVVPPEDPEALANLIKKAFRDPQFLGRLKTTAKNKREEYSWDKVAEETLKIYDKWI